MKYVDILWLAASIPMAVARCVFPTPLEPIKIIFVFVSMNLKLFKSAICSLFTDGWYKKSKNDKKVFQYMKEQD